MDDAQQTSQCSSPPARRAQFRAYVNSLKCASNDIEALTELWLNATHHFTEFYGSIPEELLSKQFDNNGTTALAVGEHVMGSALLDVAWCLKIAGLPVPEKELQACKAIQSNTRPLDTRAKILEEANRLLDAVPPILAPLTSEQVYRRSTESMSPELIIEHSIVHFYRHRRQLEVRLLGFIS